LGSTVNSAIELYKSKQKNSGNIVKSILMLLGYMLLSAQLFGQTTTPDRVVSNSSYFSAMIVTYGFIAVIAVELLSILLLIKALRFLTGIEKRKENEPVKKSSISVWQKINQFRPLEEEGNMDTGHDYDGIRELDNVTPPWFTMGFLASIVFAIIYLYRYEFAHTAPSQLQEYTMEVNEAKILQDSMLKLEGNKVDENTVAMLGIADIASGGKIYSSNCLPCHGDKGQGIVGPNLTDDYWLHGGSVKDVFKSIKYGWTEKGMKSWKDDFSPVQIAQLASYVKSLRGTNPPGAKPKQGELFSENASSDSIAKNIPATSINGK
jgi:cytochrome c oxidase cbb3-type subunit 3